MSTHSSAHGDHGGTDHVPHVLPLKTYFGTWALLMVLTVITVGASYLDLGAANLAVALLIATVKAAVVAGIFMHLKYDHRFHTVIFASSLLFLAIMVTFTMFDTENRGHAESIEGERPANMKEPFAQPSSAAPAAKAPAAVVTPAAPSVASAAAAAPSAGAPAPSASAAASAAPAGSSSAAPAAASAAAPAPSGSAPVKSGAH